MVHLGVEAHRAVGEPFDDIELPKRPAAVEQAGMQACGQRLQLFLRAGLGQHGVADVVVDIEVVVLDPHRVGQVEGHQRQLAREHRRQVQAPRQVLLDIVVPVAPVALRQLVAVQRADVHWHLGGFQMQEGAVHRAQVVHLAHGCLLEPAGPARA
jgi:hypothetical protein